MKNRNPAGRHLRAVEISRPPTTEFQARIPAGGAAQVELVLAEER